MFCTNEQLPLISSLDQLPKWKRELLENEWTKDFHDIEETHQVKECPGNQAPDEAYFDVKGKCYTVKISKVKCDICPSQDQCPMKPQKKMNIIRFSEKRYRNDQLHTLMGTEEYRQLANARAGVEEIPSAPPPLSG